MYKSGLLLAVLGAVSMSTMAADNGHGKVNFIGEIVDAPCSISPESIDQTVDLGQISNTTLAGGGSSPVQNFTIELQNCDFSGDWENKNKINLTFSGAESAAGTGLLGVTGFSGADTAKAGNVGIQINDPANKQVIMGQQLPVISTLQGGSNTLLFSSFLKGADGKAATDIPLGQFTAVTNFTITYN